MHRCKISLERWKCTVRRDKNCIDSRRNDGTVEKRLTDLMYGNFSVPYPIFCRSLA